MTALSTANNGGHPGSVQDKFKSCFNDIKAKIKGTTEEKNKNSFPKGAKDVEGGNETTEEGDDPINDLVN